jgi:hypothetical protein
MKTMPLKIQNTFNTGAVEPTITYAHLATGYPQQEAVDDPAGSVYGFPSSPEDRLYETGFLMKTFLKC